MHGVQDQASAAAMRAVRSASYETDRPDLQAHIPMSCRRVLDLGCASGALGSALKRRQNVTVVGIESSPELAREAMDVLDRVIVGDIGDLLDETLSVESPFDCLIAGDVLEHLVDPWRALAQAVSCLSPGGTAVVSLPNVAYYSGWIRLFRTGRWPRDDTGPFDRTHLRWFTIDDALDLLEQAGLQTATVEPRYWTSGWHLTWRELAARTPAHRFLAPQYILVATKNTTAGLNRGSPR